MPSKSEKQAKLMRAAAHNKAFAKKVGIDQKVAKEFEQADKKKDKVSTETMSSLDYSKLYSKDA